MPVLLTKTLDIPVDEESYGDDVTCGFDDLDFVDPDKDDSPRAHEDNEDTTDTTQHPMSVSSPEVQTHRSFGNDIAEWVNHVSESFHMKIFIIETIGQLAFSLFGPFSLPLLWVLYKGKHGLKNRGFLPGCNAGFNVQTFMWGTLALGLVVWGYYRPANLSTAELKFVLVSLVMRNMTISIKYAYMTTSWWNALQDEQTAEMIATPLMIGWYNIKYETMKLQAEISFIGIIGSRQQRSELKLQFLGWPTRLEEIEKFRARVDMTSKTLYHIPAGAVSSSRSRFRRATKRTASSGEYDRSSSNIDFGDCQLCMKGREAMTAQEADAYIFKAAAAGRKVPLEDVFMYMLRGVLRSEAVHLPGPKSLALVVVFGLFISILPSIMRYIEGLPFLGGSWQATLVSLMLIPSSMFAYFSVVMFILAGAKDFWRRRSLMRSCAALLSIQRFYRRNCPAEVDQLPPLEFTDVQTVEAWRKLRQVCQDWGRFYFNRIQAFATMFFVGTVAVVGDLVLCMEVEVYRDLNRFSMVHIVVAGLQAMTVLGCIIVLVFLGHEVNESASRHVFLLNRQRTVIASMRHRRAIEALDNGCEIPLKEDKVLERIGDLLDIICDDISSEHQVRPIRLLGLYCGYSLLSALYFIPAGTLTSFVRFYVLLQDQQMELRWYQ